MSIQLMTAVWESGALRGTELVVMLALADYANDDGECWPSVARLAQRARIKDRAAQYALQSLEKQGHITRDATGGKGRTTRYFLHPKGAENCTVPERKGCKATTQRVQSHDAKGATAIAPEPLRTIREPLEAPAAEPRGSRLPTDWQLPLPWGEWAISDLGMAEAAVRREAEKFADYWHGITGAKARKADWLATWRNWCRRAMEGRPRVKARHERTSEEDLDIRGFPDRTPRGGDEDDQRNFSRGGHQCQPAPRDPADDVPRVLAFPAQEGGPLPERDIRAGQGAGELLALRMDLCGVSR